MDDEFKERVNRLIRESEDPVELQRVLTELIKKRFPAANPFKDGEKMTMREFLARLETVYLAHDFRRRVVTIYTNSAQDALQVVIPLGNNQP